MESVKNDLKSRIQHINSLSAEAWRSFRPLTFSQFCEEEQKAPEYYDSIKQTWRSLVQGDSLAQWHLEQPSHSFLTNEYVSVCPERAGVISPSFYHEDAGRHSRGICSTLCRERQTHSANKMECLCISHLSVNIHKPLPTGTVRVCCRMISYLSGIDDNSTGPPDPLVLITIIIHPLTIAASSRTERQWLRHRRAH